MSYQVLARKWRPQTFADVVGQEHVLTALANGLSLGRIHHAYLFLPAASVNLHRPPAGKGLNCETGITATPCGVCDNCREIEQGRFVDLIEIDAASPPKSKIPATCWITSSTRRPAAASRSI
jgi:DNA polymerase-3 subunit gamma/tau